MAQSPVAFSDIAANTHLGISNDDEYQNDDECQQVVLRAALRHTATYRAMAMGVAEIAASEVRQGIESALAVFSAWDKGYSIEWDLK